MKNKKGFSLIELLVVVAIIGILSVIIAPNVQEQLRRAKVAKTKALIGSLSVMITTYKSDFGKYPPSYNPQLLFTALVEKAKNAYDPSSDEMRFIEQGDPIWVRDDASPATADLIANILQQNSVPSSALMAQDDGPVFIDSWDNPIYFISSEEYNPGRKSDFTRIGQSFNMNKPAAYEIRNSQRYKPFKPTTFQLISFGPDETTITPSQNNGGLGSMIDSDKRDNDDDGRFDNEDRRQAGDISSNTADTVAEDDITNF